ncbi:MAG TPA: hypothetical protein P5307_27475 [Pirellulaceae bacterium]|nr:hypothetical protein [Pirellulaceae bacterium]
MRRLATGFRAFVVVVVFGVVSANVPLVVRGLSFLSDPLAAIPLDSVNFPDGISPTHVYAKPELLNRSLDRIIEVWNENRLSETVVSVDESDYPFAVESNLRPMHVYQSMLICTWRLQQFDDHEHVKVRVRQVVARSSRFELFASLIDVRKVIPHG